MWHTVAYFDGTESGHLISRLASDLEMIMSPIQSSLSELLRNILIIFGGMFLCFWKSYCLSMLAFVTIGPISFSWESYAWWNNDLAREMLSRWGDDISMASQALSHIRTVKAFACEETVVQNLALHCGIKDVVTSNSTRFGDRCLSTFEHWWKIGATTLSSFSNGTERRTGGTTHFEYDCFYYR
jgi:ABC-type bacteriocin/lantibiotic exporter with double-glycine peptidase domain